MDTTPKGAALIEQAIDLLERGLPASISTIERELSPGYSASARILDELEKRGIVSPISSNGIRVYFGQGAAGRAAFEAFAAELRAGIEPAAHWWRHLKPAARRKYLPGCDEAGDFCDLSSADQGKMRLRYWKNLDQMRILQAQFAHQFTRMSAAA